MKTSITVLLLFVFIFTLTSALPINCSSGVDHVLEIGGDSETPTVEEPEVFEMTNEAEKLFDDAQAQSEQFSLEFETKLQNVNTLSIFSAFKKLLRKVGRGFKSKKLIFQTKN